MKVDEKATQRARKRQDEGVFRLWGVFGYSPAKTIGSSVQHGNTKLYRRKPGVKVLRDREHEAKHRKRKAARASRIRNRRRKP
jgi:hypothetical protein